MNKQELEDARNGECGRQYRELHDIPDSYLDWALYFYPFKDYAEGWLASEEATEKHVRQEIGEEK